MMGEGEMLEATIKLAEQKKFNKYVDFVPFSSHDNVISLMKKASIYIFSSDNNEGWGVVLNEALSCGCVCFCSCLAGATNFLIQDGINGFTYSTEEELKCKIKLFLQLNKEEVLSIRRNAIQTIKNCWNAKESAKRMHRFFVSLLDNNNILYYKEGPLSRYE